MVPDSGLFHVSERVTHQAHRVSRYSVSGKRRDPAGGAPVTDFSSVKQDKINVPWYQAPIKTSSPCCSPSADFSLLNARLSICLIRSLVTP